MLVWGINLGASSVVVEGNRFVGNETGIIIRSNGGVVRNNLFERHLVAANFTDFASAEFTNNTVVDFTWAILIELGDSPTIENNIIVNGSIGLECVLASPVFSCNDVFNVVDPYGGCDDMTGTNGNFAADPQFCGVDGSGNYFLQSDSPCAPGNHPGGESCGMIGAMPVNCETVPTRRVTWGTIKAYRGGVE
jgi:hypothetical protein